MDTVPVVNQVELHPLLPQHEIYEAHTCLGVATHTKTPAQALIRWHNQLGNIVSLKSVNLDGIVSNFDVFDFERSEQGISSIAALEDGTRQGPDPRTFNFTG